MASLSMRAMIAVFLAAGLLSLLTPSDQAPPLLTNDPPPACVEDEARAYIGKFLTAYNGGDPGTTEVFFARNGLFQQFVDPPDRTGEDARRRDTLDAHFAEQHRRGKTLMISNFAFLGYRPADNMGLYEVTLDRGNGQPIQVQLEMECGIRLQRGARIVSWVVES
jgi:hypothetical protein